MFKKIALIGLLSLSGLQGADVEPRMAMQRVATPPKKRHMVSLWLKAIIPSILSYASLEWFVRAQKNNPDRQQLVGRVKWAQWIPFFVGFYFADKWLNNDFKEWSLSGTNVRCSKKEPSTP